MSWFSPRRHRAIFHYYDGVRQRQIDPYVALKGFFRDIDENDLRGADEGDMESIEKVVGRAREVFGIDAFEDGKGLTVSETFQVLARFLEYVETVKKNTNLPPISSQSTESSGSEVASETIPKFDLGSASTATESSEDAPSQA